MVPRRLSPWTVALLVVVGLEVAAALAARDQSHGLRQPRLQPGVESERHRHAGEQQSAEHRPVARITNNGWVSGWSIQDIRTSYDSSTDTMYVGINTFANKNGQYAPFGQANGDPPVRRPLTIPRTLVVTSPSRSRSPR